MKDTPPNRDQSRLTRRQLLGLATLTTAGLAAASVGVPEAKAVPKAGEEHEPLEDFKHDLEGGRRLGWRGRFGEGIYGQTIADCDEYCRRFHAVETRRPSRAALARDRGRVGLRGKGKCSRNGHLPKRRACPGRFRTRRRLVFPERSWSRSASPWSR